MNNSTKELALCSVFAALAVALLFAGGVLSIAMYVSPMLASLVFIALRRECRRSYCWCCFAASALLALFLCPDKECAMLYCVLGYYPLVRPGLEKIRAKALRYIVKIALFSAAVGVMYALLLFIIAPPELAGELMETERVFAVALFAVGMFTFVVYDLALGRLEAVYAYKRGKSGGEKRI